MDSVTFKRADRDMEVDGKLLVEAQDGGLLLLANDNTLWAVTPDELIEYKTDSRPFAILPADELSKRLLSRLPEGFDVYRTNHYLILYNTSRAYAQWCGSLFERLYMGFNNYWSRKGFTLSEPIAPLIAVVFADKASYCEYSKDELGDAAASINGHFNLRTNHMTMCDLTGLELANRSSNRRTTASQINRLLSRGGVDRTVATIVHEATHQIAFNCGLQVRYSDCPLWFSEGLAVYFETPDLRSSRGWRTIGGVNRPRLEQFQRYLASRPANSLETLIRGDTRFRDPKQSLNAYAEAWALTYFLIRIRTEQYCDYLKLLSKKKPLLQDGPDLRLREFKSVFGDLKKLDADFLRYLRRTN